MIPQMKTVCLTLCMAILVTIGCEKEATIPTETITEEIPETPIENRTAEQQLAEAQAALSKLFGNAIGGTIRSATMAQLGLAQPPNCPIITATSISEFTIDFNNCSLDGGTTVDGTLDILLGPGTTLAGGPSEISLTLTTITVDGYQIIHETSNGTPIPPINFKNSAGHPDYTFDFRLLSQDRFRVIHPDGEYTIFTPSHPNSISPPALSIEAIADTLFFDTETLEEAIYLMTINGNTTFGGSGTLWRAQTFFADNTIKEDVHLKTEDGRPLELSATCNKVIDGQLNIYPQLIFGGLCPPVPVAPIQFPVTRIYDFGYGASDDCTDTPAMPICDTFVKVEYCTGDCVVVECDE